MRRRSPIVIQFEQEKASPVSGAWDGPANAFNRMEASVQVVPLYGAKQAPLEINRAPLALMVGVVYLLGMAMGGSLLALLDFDRTEKDHVSRSRAHRFSHNQALPERTVSLQHPLI
jgi:hypothetical protein